MPLHPYQVRLCTLSQRNTLLSHMYLVLKNRGLFWRHLHQSSEQTSAYFCPPICINRMIFDNGAFFILFFVNMPINPIISIWFFVTLHFFTLVFAIIFDYHTFIVLIPAVSRPLWGLWFLFSLHREIRCYLLQRPYSNSRRSQKTGSFANNSK